jgi:antitoxin component YwqK of YwqJK toxin-antitoxin module
MAGNVPPSPTSIPAAGDGFRIVRTHDQGHLVNEASMLQDVLQGTMVAYLPSGVASLKAHYQGGELHGPMEILDKTGNKVQESNYKRGLADGKTQLYTAGRLLSVLPYKEGALHGEMLAYAESGEVCARQAYLHGVLEGESVFMFEGKVARRCRYAKGLLDGEAVEFDRDGNLVQRSTYRNNLLDGPLTRYWPNGKRMEVLHYKAGKPLGQPQQFDDRGVEKKSSGDSLTLTQRLEKLVKG